MPPLTSSQDHRDFHDLREDFAQPLPDFTGSFRERRTTTLFTHVSGAGGNREFAPRQRLLLLSRQRRSPDSQASTGPRRTFCELAPSRPRLFPSEGEQIYG